MEADVKKLVVFCCENSAYKAADAVQDSAILDQVDIVRLPCSGKIEIGLVLKCFEHDHPGVLILGCPVDNCTYLTGNLRARKRLEMIKQALRHAGYEENRVRMDFLSSVDTHKFIRIIHEMREQITQHEGVRIKD
ncbi:hydrogenase iron-sulfur subunit [candidate division KSB3 bacterium]|jgi:coenzyme F420-reducing hydrogenase delta subunit|uniref:Hydrogenase iron-sulfur subunit n=1 Tax=candidate division KSB3 bacterium TaxID=2044937 RepID=A0A9D5JZ26_9BACT|nr:hydrogenase iron-sulfur subunit [candidate division KSB3 bacterium]MBD3326858.1 hydrogenase iron-sulfur subunit [candidate division KSB3 bacterium]